MDRQGSTLWTRARWPNTSVGFIANSGRVSMIHFRISPRTVRLAAAIVRCARALGRLARAVRILRGFRRYAAQVGRGPKARWSRRRFRQRRPGWRPRGRE